MNKLFAACLCAGGLLASPAVAQKRLEIGITGGATLASLHYGATENTHGPRWGFAAGATGVWQPAKHLGLQAALLFMQQGATQTFRGIDSADPAQGMVTDQVRLNYLRLPVCLAYTAGRSGQGLHLAAGPYAALLVGGNRKFTTTTAGTSQVVTGSVVAASAYDYSSASNNDVYSRRIDFGLQGGAGYRLGQVLLQLQYALGFRDLSPAVVGPQNGTAYEAADRAYSTRTWQASLTYLLPIKK